MNLLFLEGDMSRRGGTERMTAWLANRLALENAVWVSSLRFDAERIFFQLDPAVKHNVLKSNGTVTKIREIHRMISDHKIDVVINVDTGMGYIGILAASGTHAKVITWEHANFYNNWNSGIFPVLRRFAARNSDAMVVLTERDKQNYLRNIHKCKPITVISNPAEKHINRYDAESKIILSAGILGKIKRFDLIVPIGQIVFAKHPDWQWYLCGDGPEREALVCAVQAVGLTEHIIFCGSVRDMDAIYQKAAMYVMTSEMEGLPMVLLEAKSYGLPIVSFDIETGPSDIVRDETNGYLVESGNIEEMAAKICRLIEDDALRQEFSENAVLDIDKFDEEKIVSKWKTLIRSL